jgi:GNAT superfamily N-acetyltransferase
MARDTMRVERIGAGAEAWRRAGVYYVRVEGMVKGFDIPVEGEFSGDDDASEYVLLYDRRLPVATCRIRPLDSGRAKIERVCVLPDYRDRGVGRALIAAAEDWLSERGFRQIVIASREAVVGFYEALGYVPDWNKTEEDEFFRSVYTCKTLRAEHEPTGHES